MRADARERAARARNPLQIVADLLRRARVRPKERLGLVSIPQAIRPERRLDVVFVHGLGENEVNAWQRGDDVEAFWPKWLADEFPEVQIWMLRYEAAKFWFGGAAIPLPDRAVSVLSYLVDSKLGKCDLLFVTHSLGGLVVKQLLRISDTGGDVRLKIIAKATRGVVFLATPHIGADIAVVATRLGIASKATAGLRANDAWLRDLKDWYKNNAVGLGWQTRAFYETRPYGGSRVVSESSANPDVAGVTAIAVDADHIGICKPGSKEEPVYKAVATLIAECLVPRDPNRQAAEQGVSRDEELRRRKADEAARLYELINRLKLAWRHLANQLTGSDSDRVKAAEAEFRLVYKAYRDAYPPAAIVFDKSIMEKLERLDRLIGGPNTALSDPGDSSSAFTLEPADDAAVSQVISELLSDLQNC